jgi:predicted nucleotidyltransferase
MKEDFSMNKSGRINLRVNPDIKAKCEVLAKEAGVSLSSLIDAYLTSLAEEKAVSPQKEQAGDGVLSFALIYVTVNAVLSSFGKDKVQKAYLFGSYARGEAKKESDVDILVEPGEKLTLFDLGRINGELSEKLGKAVDTIASLDDLDPRMRSRVLHDRKILYEVG